MKKAIIGILSGLFIGAGAGIYNAQAQRPVCGDTPDMVKTLKHQFALSTAFIGITPDKNSTFELLVNPETNAFVIIKHFEGGNSCIMGQGKGMINEVKPGMML